MERCKKINNLTKIKSLRLLSKSCNHLCWLLTNKNVFGSGGKRTKGKREKVPEGGHRKRSQWWIRPWRVGFEPHPTRPKPPPPFPYSKSSCQSMWLMSQLKPLGGRILTESKWERERDVEVVCSSWVRGMLRVSEELIFFVFVCCEHN